MHLTCITVTIKIVVLSSHMPACRIAVIVILLACKEYYYDTYYKL